jgi:hypothetical protein
MINTVIYIIQYFYLLVQNYSERTFLSYSLEVQYIRTVSGLLCLDISPIWTFIIAAEVKKTTTLSSVD